MLGRHCPRPCSPGRPMPCKLAGLLLVAYALLLYVPLSLTTRTNAPWRPLHRPGRAPQGIAPPPQAPTPATPATSPRHTHPRSTPEDLLQPPLQAHRTPEDLLLPPLQAHRTPEDILRPPSERPPGSSRPSSSPTVRPAAPADGPIETVTQCDVAYGRRGLAQWARGACRQPTALLPALPAGAVCHFLRATAQQPWAVRVETGQSADRPPLVVVHGGPGQSHDYLAPMLAISSSMPVILYDQAGSGRSTAAPPNIGEDINATMAKYTAELHGVLAAFRVGAAHVLGQSFGGNIALSFAARHPQQVLSLVLLSSSHDMPSWREAAAFNMQQLTSDATHTLESRLGGLSYTKRHIFGPIPMRAARDYMCNSNARVYSTVWGASEPEPDGQVQAYAAAPLVAAVGAPVLLISGVHDEVTPFALSQQHDAFANATRRRMALLPRSAHVPAPEDWPDLRREVLAFLDPAAPTPDADVPPPSPQETRLVAQMRGAMRGYMRSRDIDEAALAHFVSVLTDGAAARDAVDPEAFVRIAHAAVGPMPGGADRLQSVLDVWYVATILGHPDAPRVRPPAPSLAHAIAFLRQAQPRGGLLRAMQPVYQYIFRQSLRRCGVAEAEGVPDVPWERVMQDIPPQSVIMRVYLLTHVVLYATDLGLAPRVTAELRRAGDELLKYTPHVLDARASLRRADLLPEIYITLHIVFGDAQPLVRVVLRSIREYMETVDFAVLQRHPHTIATIVTAWSRAHRLPLFSTD